MAHVTQCVPRTREAQDHKNRVLWQRPAMPALREKDEKFKVTLGYIVNLG